MRGSGGRGGGKEREREGQGGVGGGERDGEAGRGEAESMRERRAGAVWPAAPAGAQTAKGVHHPEGRGMGGTTGLLMPSLRACRAIPGGAGNGNLGG